MRALSHLSAVCLRVTSTVISQRERRQRLVLIDHMQWTDSAKYPKFQNLAALGREKVFLHFAVLALDHQLEWVTWIVCWFCESLCFIDVCHPKPPPQGQYSSYWRGMGVHLSSWSTSTQKRLAILGSDYWLSQNSRFYLAKELGKDQRRLIHYSYNIVPRCLAYCGVSRSKFTTGNYLSTG